MESSGLTPVVVTAIIILVIWFFKCLNILREYERAVVFRLGRVLKKDKGPVATVALDAFDVFNHVNYPSYVGNMSSPYFGKAASALSTRRLQLSARFKF